MQPNLIVDQATVPKFDRCLREDFEIQPGRSDLFQPERITEKIENTLTCLRQHDGTSEFVAMVLGIPIDLNHVAGLSNLDTVKLSDEF